MSEHDARFVLLTREWGQEAHRYWNEIRAAWDIAPANPNRWAAFTDGELKEIRLAYAVNFKMLESRGESPFQSVIAAGVEAELERRRATHTVQS